MNQEFPQNQQGTPQEPSLDSTAPVNPPAAEPYDSTTEVSPPAEKAVVPPVPQPEPVAPPTPVQQAPAYGYAPPAAPTPPPAVTQGGYPVYYRSFSPYAKPASPQKSRKGLIIFICLLLAVILFLAGVAGGYFITHSDPSKSFFGQLFNGEETSEIQGNNGPIIGEKSDFSITVEESDGTAYSYEQIVAKVSPSIVNITVYSPDGEKGSYASGIIMDAQKGYVLTNDHIYGEVPNAKFLITLQDKTEFKATFVSGDARSDIAILKIENPQNLVAATFSVTPANVGAKVLAIGQSYGYADTVTEGIVSSENRRISLRGGGYSEQYIQTTAAINPGSSGGALVNMSGQVIGITTAKIANEDVESLGFAIPSEQALKIVKNLQENGYVKGRAKLGITYKQIGTIQAETNGVPVGIYVQSIEQDADIAKKGVVAGDIITHVNGAEIKNSTVLLDIIDNCKAGDSLPITVYQTATGTSVELSVVLGEVESSNSYQIVSSENSTQTVPF